MNKIYDHGDIYKKYNMEGDIHIGTGIVRVHNIFDDLPDFMFKADVIFSDPPYNQSALSGYYSKAGVEKKEKFVDFFDVFMKRVAEINPRILILEVGVPQQQMYLDRLLGKYDHIVCKNALYYDKGKCSIIIASNEPIPQVLLDIPEVDEEKIIEYVCKNLDYKCIADPCMGKGLVGWYSHKYGKPFVGTELNKKRLAILLERITTGKRGKTK